jgi:phage terminase large subunit
MKLLDRVSRIKDALQVKAEGPDRPLFTLAQAADYRYCLAEYDPPAGFKLPLATAAELAANDALERPRPVLRLGFVQCAEEGGLIRNPTVVKDARGLTLFPDGFQYLFEPGRVKVAYGGRDSGKSWNFARALLLIASVSPLQVYCCREWQASMRDSVHKLLRERIIGLKLQRYFEVQLQVIRSKAGAEFVFAGLASDPAGVKSAESFDIAWVEEAYNISRSSWNHLEPTIRKSGSEIWVSFNPSQEDDFIYQKFVANAPPPDAIVRKFNYNDNPWLSEALKVTRQYMADTDPEEYLNVYAGQCKVLNSSVVYGGRYERGILTLPEDPVARRREWGDFLLGVDFGFAADPSVMLKVWCSERLRTIYIEKESWGKHVESQDLALKFLRDIPEARNYPARCDNARPETISQLRPSPMQPEGIQAKACEKWKGSVEDGIAFIKSQKIVVHPSCKNTWDELGKYRYRVDRQTGDVLPELVDKDNHACDALRYSLEPFVMRSGSRAGMWAWAHLDDRPGRIV